MKLRVIREPSLNGATLGSLYVDGKWECWTLEDVIREAPIGLYTDMAAWVASWKVPGETAIPEGLYDVTLSMSNRFKIVLPEVLRVAGFTGIRMHAGNKSKDTEGCLLVGQGRGDALVTSSQLALDALMLKLDAAFAIKQPISIQYENPK